MLQRQLRVDVGQVTCAIPEKQTQYADCQLVARAKAQSFTPAPVDPQIPFPFGPGSQGPELGINRIITQTIDIVATGQTDVVGT